MYVGNQGSVPNLDQNALTGGCLLCSMHADISHREPTIIKLDWQPAVTRAMSHLNKDFAACLDEFTQAVKDSVASFLIRVFVSPTCNDAHWC